MSDREPGQTFVAVRVEGFRGPVATEDGVVNVHALTFTNLEGETVQIIYLPEMGRHVANAATACIIGDMRESIALTEKRRNRALRRD